MIAGSSPPRVVVVTRPTDYEALLVRHGTREQARFFLQTRGQDIAEVVVAPPHPLLLGVGVTGSVPGRRRSVVAEPVLRLLRLRDEHLGVLGKGRVDRGGPGLGGADDQEVGPCGARHGGHRPRN